MSRNASISSSLDDQLLILVGNGACDPEQLAAAPKGRLVAVDGGVRHCQAAGRIPSAIIGDMDSAPPDLLQSQFAHVPVLENRDQDTTDLEKALLSFSVPIYLAYGFLGLRLDHTLAVLSVLARYADRRKVILIGADDVVHVTTRFFSMTLSVGARLSVWPLDTVHFTASSGLVWPLDGLTLSPQGQVATSNRMQANCLTLTPQDGNQAAYAVCCDPEFLSVMLRALMSDSCSENT